MDKKICIGISPEKAYKDMRRCLKSLVISKM